MSAPKPQLDDLHEAADLTFAILRFVSAAVPASTVGRPKGGPSLGDEAYQFIPGPSRPIPNAEVPQYLASLPSPAYLIPTAIRGSVALILLDELTGDRLARTRHDFANQQNGIELTATQDGLLPDSPILLEFDGESHIYRFAALRVWSQRFAVAVGWNLQTLEDDARAVKRMVLFRHDGMMSTGKRLGRQEG